MRSYGIHEERIWPLTDRPTPPRGDYVLYWMQQAQRARYNHALEYAVLRANALGLPVLVVFGLTESYPSANLRHFVFLLEGLLDTSRALARRGIPFSVRLGDPAEVAIRAAGRAALIVADRGYLRHQKRWREQVARGVACPVVEVETDVVVPLYAVSDHAEFAARTIRPKIHRVLRRYLVPLRPVPLENPGEGRLSAHGLDLSKPGAILAKMRIDRSVAAVSRFFQGGTAEAERRFERFLKEGFQHYVEDRGEPASDHTSRMSPYLHFGQISPLWLALRVQALSGPKDAKESFLEELIVRRELAMNFVNFRPGDYDRISSIPDWAKRTLAAHRRDQRKPAHHDPYWNAATREMLATGYMHNHMRMYWAKKILEWTRDPGDAYRTTLEIMNRYFLDGRDPNSYAGVAWTYGLHDRPWGERPIYGKVRSMTAAGLERKADMAAYLRKVELLEQMAAAA